MSSFALAGWSEGETNTLGLNSQGRNPFPLKTHLYIITYIQHVFSGPDLRLSGKLHLNSMDQNQVNQLTF